MPNPFHDAYLVPRDRPNPYKPRTEAFELFELGKYYRQHVKDFEGIHRDGNVYRGTRSGEAFRFNYV